MFCSACCCGSVTGMQGGLHPDMISADWVDVIPDNTAKYTTSMITRHPVHVLSATVSLVMTRDDSNNLPEEADAQNSGRDSVAWDILASGIVSFGLFWDPGANDDTITSGGWQEADGDMDGRVFFAHGAVTASSPSWQMPPELWGFFCNKGVFIEVNAPSSEYGVRCAITSCPRDHFYPAYARPVDVATHYWQCSHCAHEFPSDCTNLLDGFESGEANQIILDSSETEPDTPPDLGDKKGGNVLSTEPTEADHG